MKKISTCLIYVVAFAVVNFIGTGAFAFQSRLDAFNLLYGTGGTKLNTCLTCHTDTDGSAFNPYGNDLQQNTGSDVAARLQMIESLDSDGDLTSNHDEIVLATTFPGDSSDFPTFDICDDGVDNDGDGLMDCADQDCQLDVNCQLPSNETSCTDGLDNDGDGFIDCADADCSNDSACLPSSETSCTDGIDNDNDGLIDCDDTDCAGQSACLPNSETSCTDSIDNDADGYTDCADQDCAGLPDCQAPVIENCSDSVDNDFDGFIDCMDPDCTSDQSCISDDDEEGHDDENDEDDEDDEDATNHNEKRGRGNLDKGKGYVTGKGFER